MKFRSFFILVLISVCLNLLGQTKEYIFKPELESLKSTLRKASLRSNETKDAVLIKLPDDSGQEIDFYAWESPVISEEMAKSYPDFKTYFISSVKNSSIAGRIFVSRFGVEGMFDQNGRQVKIEPVANETSGLHKIFKYESDNNLTCGSTDLRFRPNKKDDRALTFSNGSIRRTYDIAIATTGEFFISSAFGNNSLVSANAAITNIINLNNVRYNIEMAIHFTIANSPAIYQDTLTDPFTPWGSNLTTQANTSISNVFNANSYDIGHVLHATSSGGSGVAGLGVVCIDGSKARGWSGGSNQNTLAIAIMIHEIGHMFGSHHTFNGNQGFCGSPGQHSSNTAFEIGSGTTIMSYAGLCNSQNIQSTQDNYFHSKSLEIFLNHVTTNVCHTASATGNNPPSVNANPCSGTYIIPKLTPFSMEGSVVDTDPGQTITYVWEQIDEDGIDTLTKGFIGTQAGNSNIAPLFRSYPPSTTGYKRTFPNINTIISNANVTTFEPLPNIARNLNFRLTARDNNTMNGGIGSDDISISVSGTSGPLTVTSPNTNVNWSTGTQTITWDVNNTNTLFANVDILLSIDGGFSFPYSLTNNTPNDGTEVVTIPSVPNTSTARIKVRYAPNACFEIFDMSNVNFTITSSCLTKSSIICPASSISFPYGNINLSLNLENIYDSLIVNNISGSITSSQPTVNRGIANSEGSLTCTIVGTRKVLLYDFTVPTSGSYTFNLISSSVFTAMSIFSGFNQNSPCTSLSFLGSNAWATGGGGASSYSSFSVNLTECTKYTLAVYSNATNNFSIAVSSPIKLISLAPTSPYNAFTYIAVNTSDNVIKAENPLSNFTTLPASSYNVFGVNFHNVLNPSTWIGQTLSSLIGSGQCLVVSSNFKPVNVTCPTINLPNINITESSGLLNNDGTICNGAQVTLAASGGGTYLWSNNATTSSISVNPFVTTLYTVTVTNSAGCSATTTTTITVNSNPSGSISVTESSGTANNDGIICSGASVVLTASGGNSYLWSTGANTASIVVSPTLTTTYTVTPTNANGCTATTSSLISVNGTIVDNSENTGLGTLRDIFNCVPAAATITYQSGVGSELTSPLIINKNVTIQGNGLSTTTLDFNMSSGICLTVQAGTTLTFKDITINMAGGTNGPVIENFGNLVLDNVRVISNASIGNPAVRNNSSGNVSLLNQTIIKQP